MIDRFKFAAASVLHYLGDAAHKRFVVTVLVLIANHVLGHALDADQISTALDVLLGGFAGAWSRNTPKIEEPINEDDPH